MRRIILTWMLGLLVAASLSGGAHSFGVGNIGAHYGALGQVVVQSGLTAGQRATLSRLKPAASTALGNNAVDNADMASPPTITTASSHDATLTVRSYASLNPELFTISDGYKWRRTVNNRLYITTDTFAPNGSGSLFATFNVAGQMSPEVPTNGYDTANNWEIRFVTSSDVVEIEHQPSSTVVPYRYIVDEGAGPRYVARDGQQVTAAANQFVKLTFASQIPRTITVEAQSGHLVGGIAVKTGFAITAPGGVVTRAAVLGDSFCEAINQGTYGGVSKFWQWDGLGNVFARKAGITHMLNAGVGGTGYWNQSGGVPGTRSNVAAQLDYWIGLNTYDLLVFASGFNDSGNVSDATMRTNARAAWVKARAAQPNAMIMVMGIWGGNTLANDSSSRIVSEAALLAEFNSWGDRFSRFIPVSPSFAGAWMNGTGYEGHTNGTGNSDIYGSTDGVHPNRTGHIYLGGRMDPAYRSAIATLH